MSTEDKKDQLANSKAKMSDAAGKSKEVVGKVSGVVSNVAKVAMSEASEHITMDNIKAASPSKESMATPLIVSLIFGLGIACYMEPKLLLIVGGIFLATVYVKSKIGAEDKKKAAPIKASKKPKEAVEGQGTLEDQSDN